MCVIPVHFISEYQTFGQVAIVVKVKSFPFEFLKNWSPGHGEIFCFCCFGTTLQFSVFAV